MYDDHTDHTGKKLRGRVECKDWVLSREFSISLSVPEPKIRIALTVYTFHLVAYLTLNST